MICFPYASNNTLLAHQAGGVILVVIWLVLPMVFLKDPVTWPKRYCLAAWYLGVALIAAIYLVTR